ncbi:replication endonuclease [Vibrio harveyi]|uniref:Replication endonuclease n=1 Tax=Vibrio harveyi TaxID=669 RepID=A0A8B3DJH0_VIBHA|nr:replication endonuclease [Vibrio harveyi]RIW13241.1 replication endonuclease [Vibrio harveyi]
MKTYTKPTKNPLTKLPDSLRQELAAYVVKNQGTTYNQATPKDRVFAFAHQVANRFKLPNDIRNYLDKASAVRFRKYGFKRAIEFIESRSSAASAALAVLPEPYWAVDTELKRARLATELSGRAGFRLNHAVAKEMSPFEAIEQIHEFAGAALWMPHFRKPLDEDEAYSLLARLIDESVWRRAIEKYAIAAFENARRAAGMVSPHISPYASISACEWLKIRQDRQREWLELMAIESEEGQVVSMMDVHKSSQSNMENRRHELMTRIAGCQEYADSNAHASVFITMTAPSRFHRLTKRGEYWIENRNWDGSTPRDAHAWLSTSWERFRAWAGRHELTYYGMRVVEPHQDGTPHWHGVFFMPLEQVPIFIKALQSYQFQRDSAELYTSTGQPKFKAMKARFEAKLLDGSEGGAVAYLAKYISKNVDGFGLEDLTDLDNRKAKLQDTVKNVTAWSRNFCFRQFQFQKTPSVTVWRELRRIQDEQEYCTFEKARRAADNGFFSAYFDYMGGHRLPQSMRPIKPMKEGKENKYGELVPVIVGITGSGLSVLTHEIEWKLIKKPSDLSEASNSKRELAPWSSGNNCTRQIAREVKATRQQQIISNFFLNMELNGGGSPEWEEFWNG